MSATNLTKNLKLPQFVASDKPSWLGDVNGAMKNIDDGIGVIKGDITKASDTASSAKSQSDANAVTLGNINTELESVGNRVTALEAGGGTEQLEQRVQTVEGDVEALQTRADTFEEEIAKNGTEITNVTKSVATLEPRVKANEDGITRLDASVEGLSGSVQSLATQTQANKNSIEVLNANIGNLPTRVSALERREDITISSLRLKGSNTLDSFDSLNGYILAIRSKTGSSNSVYIAPFVAMQSSGNLHTIGTNYYKLFEISTSGSIIDNTLIIDGESTATIMPLALLNGAQRVQIYYKQESSTTIGVYVKGFSSGLDVNGAVFTLPRLTLNS